MPARTSRYWQTGLRKQVLTRPRLSRSMFQRPSILPRLRSRSGKSAGSRRQASTSDGTGGMIGGSIVRGASLTDAAHPASSSARKAPEGIARRRIDVGLVVAELGFGGVGTGGIALGDAVDQRDCALPVSELRG